MLPRPDNGPMALLTLLNASLAFGHVALLDHADFSLETSERIGLIGRNGTGKSSLLNALAGAELAIVTPVAGTTRDKVQQTIQIEGVPVHVIDTAGLRDSEDEVEKIGIERAWDAIETADAVLFLHDLTRLDAMDYVADDADIARALAAKLPSSVAVIDVWNKADTTAAPPSCADRGVTLSAKTGAGLQALRHEIDFYLDLLPAAGWAADASDVRLEAPAPAGAARAYPAAAAGL